MPVDFSFLQNAAPPKPEQPETSLANVTVRVDADCFMQCDGEYVDVPLKAGQVTKTELPIGQHLLEFLSTENPNVKVEKMVDFPESGKNYLVMVNELKAAVAPPMPQGQPQQVAPQNQFLDALNVSLEHGRCLHRISYSRARRQRESDPDGHGWCR